MVIKIDTLTKLEQLFKTKEWEIISDSAMFSSIFNRFCRRLELFEEDKQQLLIELGYRFIDLGIGNFKSYFSDAVNKITDIHNYKTIIIAPLKKPSRKDTKSADHIWYHLKNFTDFSYDPFGSRLLFSSDWNIIARSLNQNTMLFLVDDFIGTGGTVIETLEEIYTNKLIAPTHNVRVVAFLAQREGINNIHSKFPGIVTVSEILHKGISDWYAGVELKNKTDLMLQMEKKLKVFPQFEFGYGKSESLVAISSRSVNNTFPVFWLEKKSLAPFKR